MNTTLVKISRICMFVLYNSYKNKKNIFCLFLKGIGIWRDIKKNAIRRHPLIWKSIRKPTLRQNPFLIKTFLFSKASRHLLTGAWSLTSHDGGDSNIDIFRCLKSILFLHRWYAVVISKWLNLFEEQVPIALMIL